MVDTPLQHGVDIGDHDLEWQTGVVVHLFKKRYQRVCSNYLGITLLSSPGKVYSRVLERRVRLLVEPRIQEEQFGFHPGRGTQNQPYTPVKVLEGAWECAQPVHIYFMDLEKAYDHVLKESCGGLSSQGGWWLRSGEEFRHPGEAQCRATAPPC